MAERLRHGCLERLDRHAQIAVAGEDCGRIDAERETQTGWINFLAPHQLDNPVYRRSACGMNVNAQVDAVQLDVVQRSCKRLGSCRKAVAEGIWRAFEDDGKAGSPRSDVLLRLMIGTARIDVIDTLNDGPASAGAAIRPRPIVTQLLELEIGIGGRRRHVATARRLPLPQDLEPPRPVHRRKNAGTDDHRFHVPFQPIDRPNSMAQRTRLQCGVSARQMSRGICCLAVFIRSRRIKPIGRKRTAGYTGNNRAAA